MVTTEFCVSGNSLTGRLNTERRPSTTSSRLTTMESTGRRMKMSVNFMGAPSSSAFLRLRVGAVGRQHRVVDFHRRAVLELERGAGQHGLPLPYAGGDR